MSQPTVTTAPLTDFRPLLARPFTLILGAAAQVGIFIAALGAHYVFGFDFPGVYSP